MVAEEGDRNSSKMYLPSISLHSYYFRKLKSEESRDECGRKMDRGMGYRMEKALFSPNSWSLLFYSFLSLHQLISAVYVVKIVGYRIHPALPPVSSLLSSLFLGHLFTAIDGISYPCHPSLFLCLSHHLTSPVYERDLTIRTSETKRWDNRKRNRGRIRKGTDREMASLIHSLVNMPYLTVYLFLSYDSFTLIPSLLTSHYPNSKIGWRKRMAGEGIVKGREEWDRSVLEMDSESWLPLSFTHCPYLTSYLMLNGVEAWRLTKWMRWSWGTVRHGSAIIIPISGLGKR